MQLFKNIAIINPILMENKSGLLTVVVDESVSVTVCDGQIVVDDNKDLFIKNIQHLQIAEITFVEQTTPKTYQIFSLVGVLWEMGHTTNNISQICKEHLYHRTLKKGLKNIFYKLADLTNEDFLVYLFFIKSEIRTLADLIAFYPNKDAQKLENATYRLFLVGELIFGKEVAPQETTENTTDMVKRMLLQKLLNKVSSLSYK